MNKLSANEVFTPPYVAAKVIDSLRFSDKDWLAVVESVERGDTRGIVDIGAKTGVFLVVAYKRAMQAIENSDYSANRKQELISVLKDKTLYTVPASSVAYLSIKKLFYEQNWNADNIIGSEIFKKGAGLRDFAHHLVRLTDIYNKGDHPKSGSMFSILEPRTTQGKWNHHFNSIANIDSVEDADVWRLVDKMAGKEFSAAVGNPPYQITLDTGQQGEKIYSDFWHAAVSVSNYQSMVFMLGWQDHRLTDFRRMREDKSIFFVDNYYETDAKDRLFSATTGGVSIVARSKHHSAGPEFFEHGDKTDKDFYEDAPENRLEHWFYRQRPQWSKIKVRGNAQNGFSGVSTKESSANPSFTVVSDFVDRETVASPDKGVLLVQNNTVGKTGRAVVYQTTKDKIVLNKDTVNKYKVVTPVSWKPTILHPNVMAGRIRPVIGVFDTEEEALNAHLYFSSAFSELLKDNTPNLEDYTNSNPLFTPDDMLSDEHKVYKGMTFEDRLSHYFELNVDELAMIDS